MIASRSSWLGLRIPGLLVALELAVRLFLLSLALELEKAIHVLVPEEWHGDRPGARKDLGVFKLYFVLDRVRIDHRVALGHLQLFAVEVAGGVQPRLVVEVGDL